MFGKTFTTSSLVLLTLALLAVSFREVCAVPMCDNKCRQRTMFRVCGGNFKQFDIPDCVFCTYAGAPSAWTGMCQYGNPELPGPCAGNGTVTITTFLGGVDACDCDPNATPRVDFIEALGVVSPSGSPVTFTRHTCGPGSVVVDAEEITP